MSPAGARMLSVTPGDLARLKRRYMRALEASEESFAFKFEYEQDLSELLTSYAKYLIEYLESHIGK